MDDNSSERNTELKTEELVVVSKEEEAHLALKELPDYVADSFMTTGYDTLQVISRMDTSRNPGNALEEVEQYISLKILAFDTVLHTVALQVFAMSPTKDY